MLREIPYQYISIEGNIGTGKTALCQRIGEDYNCDLILEEFAENPFLKHFYKNPERYAFSVELFFMTERHKQLQHHLLKPSLFSDFAISDYVFWKSVIFGRRTLNTDEYKLMLNLFQVLNKGFPEPDLLVYLHRSPDQLLENIRERNRPYEVGITREYLAEIQDSYFEFFRNQTSFPILVLELGDLDFVSNDKHYEEVRHLLTRRYQPGVHRISLHL